MLLRPLASGGCRRPVRAPRDRSTGRSGADGQPPSGPAWIGLAPVERATTDADDEADAASGDNSETDGSVSSGLQVNRYFAEHPEMVLGDHALRRGICGPALILWRGSRLPSRQSRTGGPCGSGGPTPCHGTQRPYCKRLPSRRSDRRGWHKGPRRIPPVTLTYPFPLGSLRRRGL